jgi:hypothetical protein
VESGRIIIDPHTFSIYGMPGPNLEPIESKRLTGTADDPSFDEDYDVIHKATSKAYQEYQKALQKYEKQLKRSDSSPRREPVFHLLIFTATLVNLCTSHNTES